MEHCVLTQPRAPSPAPAAGTERKAVAGGASWHRVTQRTSRARLRVDGCRAQVAMFPHCHSFPEDMWQAVWLICCGTFLQPAWVGSRWCRFQVTVPRRTTERACTLPSVTSPMWKPQGVLIHLVRKNTLRINPSTKIDTFWANRTREMDGKIHRDGSTVDSKMGFCFQMKEEGRREGAHRQIHLQSCLLFPSLRFPIHNDSKGTEKTCHQGKPAYTTSKSTPPNLWCVFVLLWWGLLLLAHL